MRKRQLDLTAVTVESFYTAGGPSLSSNAEVTEFTCFTCYETCGYSCQVCDTENDTGCSTDCFKATYVWETC